MQEIILASSSPYRKELLGRLGIQFTCISPGIDEDQYKAQISDPHKLCETLGNLKARAVVEKYPNAIVIGSDQLVTIDSKVLGKTGNEQGSIEQLKYLSGKTHQLITSVTIFNTSKDFFQFTDTTVLYMKELSPSQIQEYVRHDRPFDCAGSYKLEKRGIALFDKIECKDYTSIIGLPLIELARQLNKFGVMVPPNG